MKSEVDAIKKRIRGSFFNLKNCGLEQQEFVLSQFWKVLGKSS